ncbi:MAG: SufD family Fe-S cluster assembly protein [Paludibacteraceae bacterium]|nr:SufD family Fe-S cluster assembly protein [Paludibacteraceae bacterium]
MSELIEISKGQTKNILLLNKSVDLLVNQYDDSQLNLHVFCLDDSSAEINIQVRQLGRGCSAKINALVLACGKQEVGIHTNVVHEVGDGISEQLLKFVLADESKGNFRGDLKIAKDAQKVSARQTNRNIVLSDKAKMRTMPQLEIYADDVKASHGASTGQLDEQALFYMQQRGLSVGTARKLLLKAFASEVMEQLDVAEHDSIEQLIEQRLARMAI